MALLTELIVQKATQIGMSMLMWRWAAWRADVWGDTVLYVFPTEKHVSKFGDERIEPSIQASPYLTRRIPSEYVRQKQLKRIGNGWLHLQGANSRAGAQSVAADVLVFDEYDELDPGNVEQIERRISGAAAAGRLPRVRRVGIPTIPGFGVDAPLQALRSAALAHRLPEVRRGGSHLLAERPLADAGLRRTSSGRAATSSQTRAWWATAGACRCAARSRWT